MSASEIRFSVAGLEVALESEQPDGLDSLAGFYSEYPSTGARPLLVLEIERIPGLDTGQERGPEYPGFHRGLSGPGVIALSRFDADGELRVVGDHIRGRFRVAESENTVEAVVRIGMSLALPRHGGLLMHASAIAVNERAHVFAGVSGAGKSTIAAMLADHEPSCTKLSDELLIIAPGRGRDPAVHVTPFIGSHGLPHGTSTPIAAVYFLNQAPFHRREPLRRTAGLRELLRHVLVYVTEPDTAAHVLDVASRLVRDTPCHRLHFAKDPGVASVLVGA